MATMFDRLFGFDSQEEDKSIGDMLREYTSAVNEDLKNADRNVVGLGEAIGTIGSGMVAEPAAGAVGLLSLASGLGVDNSVKGIEKTREAMTYMPRTPEGQQYVQSIGEALAPIGEAIEGAAKKAGHATLDATGSPVAATAVDTLIQAAPDILGLGVAGKTLPKGQPIIFNDIGTAPMNKQRGIFAGFNAMDAPKGKYLEADDLADQGKSPERIFEETGILRDAGGNMMHVIDDSGAKFKFDDGNRKIERNGFMLEDVLDHPELYKAYPELRLMEIDLIPDYKAIGRHVPNKNKIILRHGGTDPNTGEYKAYTPKEMLKTLLHELNHKVQLIEDLPTGGNLGVGAVLGTRADDAARYGADEMGKITKQVDDIYANPDRTQASKLLSEARKLDEIDRLKGYLQDYYRGGNLTGKRRHILSSGQFLMDVNKESRMRHNTLTAKPHRPKAERDAQFASYIESVIADAESRLDPKLVETVRGSGVKNPAKKYERQVDKLSKDIKPLMEEKRELEKQVSQANKYGKDTFPEFAVMERGDGTFFVSGVIDPVTLDPKKFSSRYDAEQAAIEQFGSYPNYEKIAGETMSRVTEEMWEKGIKNPFETDELKNNPLDQLLYLAYTNTGDKTMAKGTPFYDLWAKAKAEGHDPSIPTPKIFEASEADYRGVHTAPLKEEGVKNTLDDMADMYPEDVYDPRVSPKYYGHTGAGDPLDQRSADLVAAFQGKPDAEVTIYRAVPKGVKEINSGDWVTLNKNYAKSHGDSWVDGGDYDIISKKVKAKDIVTDGNSIHEFGYDPD